MLHLQCPTIGPSFGFLARLIRTITESAHLQTGHVNALSLVERCGAYYDLRFLPIEVNFFDKSIENSYKIIEYSLLLTTNKALFLIVLIFHFIMYILCIEVALFKSPTASQLAVFAQYTVFEVILPRNSAVAMYNAIFHCNFRTNFNLLVNNAFL